MLFDLFLSSLNALTMKHWYRHHFGHASPLSFKDMHVFRFSANEKL